MKTRQTKLFLVLAWSSSLWMLTACTPATSEDASGGAEPPEAATTTETATGEPPAEARPTDIIDRFFSPLDNAVDDINRDLNKGDADASTESNE
jgi:hypothetical protein